MNWYKKIKAKIEDGYFPDKRDPIWYLPEIDIWRSSNYDGTQLANAIMNPKLRANYQLSEDMWKKLEERFMDGKPLEKNQFEMNLQPVTEKIVRKEMK